MRQISRVLVVLSALLLSACTAPEQTKWVLKQQGFTDIETTGWDAFACSEDDTFSTGFRARNANGDQVSGAVCCGLFTKACTVRFY